MKKIKLKGYVVEKSRKGEKTRYLQTAQCFVNDIYEAKIYKDKKDAEKDMDIASFNHYLYEVELQAPKYNFKLIEIN